MIQLIFQSIFFGYGLFSIIKVALAFTKEEKEGLLSDYDKTATEIVKFAGLVFALYCFTITFLDLKSNNVTNGDDEFRMINWISSPFYWFTLLIHPVIVQLLWVKGIRYSKFIRFLLGILLMFSGERILLILTSFHRDYLPSSWDYSISSLLSKWAIQTIIFGIVLFVIQILKNKRKNAV